MRLSRRGWLGVGAGVSLALAGVLWLLVLPWYVRRRMIAEAEANGITLTFDGDVRVGLGSVSAGNLRATSKEGVTVTAGRAEVELRGLSPVALSLSNASIDIGEGFGEPRAAQKAGSLERVSLANSRLEWRRARGTALTLRAGDVSGEIGLGDAPARLHLASVTLEVGAISVGPWSAAITRDARATTTTVELGQRPGVGTLEITSSIAALTITARVPQETPLTELGFPAPLLTMASLERAGITLDARHTEDAARGSGTAALRLSGVRLAAAGAPVAVGLAGVGYEGPLAEMPIQRGHLELGPLSGPLGGFVGRIGERDVRVGLSAKTQAISCADALAVQAGSFGQSLVDFGRAIAGDVVKGEVTVDLALQADSRSFAETRLAITPHASCALVFLPAR